MGMGRRVPAGCMITANFTPQPLNFQGMNVRTCLFNKLRLGILLRAGLDYGHLAMERISILFANKMSVPLSVALFSGCRNFVALVVSSLAHGDLQKKDYEA
jgi:hypothetical protein